VRLFFAAELRESVRALLLSVSRELSSCGADVRWTRPEGMHLTLAFLGEVPPAGLDALRRAGEGAAAAVPPYRLALRGLGAFPAWDLPRVLWAGLSAGVEESSRLAAALRSKLREAGFPLEERSFMPHVTLGRLRSSRNSPLLAEAARAWDAPERWAGAESEVAGFALIESRLSGEGPIYGEVAKFRLGAPA
jgi:2'-5' RNA ligase